LAPAASEGKKERKKMSAYSDGRSKLRGTKLREKKKSGERVPVDNVSRRGGATKRGEGPEAGVSDLGLRGRGD